MLALLLSFIISMGLCWSIGGEYRFGRGRRGLLLAIPITTCAIIAHVELWLVLVQIYYLWIIYQSLSYSNAIEMIYEKRNIKGWLIICANGLLVGLTPACLFIDNTHQTILVKQLVVSLISNMLFFCFAIMLSNSKLFEHYRDLLADYMPQYIPYIDNNSNLCYYINLKDAWYVSELLIGMWLAMTIIIK